MKTKIRLHNLDRLYKELQGPLTLKAEQVYKTGRHLLGPFTQELENRIANVADAEYCVMTGSGSDSLYLGLLACGLDANTRISYPSQTFIATRNSIQRSYNLPVPADVKPNGLINWKDITTDHVVWVGLFGNTENISTNHIVYEDGAQHFGAPLQGEFASYSFDPTKALPNWGNAGAVVTNDVVIANNVRELRRHGRDIGGNSIPSERECAELLVKLDFFPFWQERRQEVAFEYIDEIGDLVKCVTDPYGQISKFVIDTAQRPELEKHLANHGIETKRVYEHPLADTPQAIKNCNTQLALPVDPYITDEELDFIIIAIKQFFEESPLES